MLLALVVSSDFPGSTEWLNATLVFANMYLRSAQSNRLCLVQGLRILHDSDASDDPADLQNALLEAASPKSGEAAALSSDFGYALLLVQRETQRGGKGRVLLFSCNEDQDLSLIKCAFTANKQDVRVDAVVTASSFVAEVFEVMKGCIKVVADASANILPFLISTLSLNSELTTELKSIARTCMCHDNPVLVGYLCPICLGLYCRFVPICRHCKNKFVFTTGE